MIDEMFGAQMFVYPIVWGKFPVMVYELHFLNCQRVKSFYFFIPSLSWLHVGQTENFVSRGDLRSKEIFVRAATHKM